LATASAAQSNRGVFHVRGNWSAQDDRVPSAVWLAILWIGMIAGFGLDFPRFLRENPPAPFVVRVHAAVFAGWLLILTPQVLLILRGRLAWHRKLGWFAVGWACVMAVLGPWAAIESQAANLHSPIGDPPFLSVQLLNMVEFLSLLTWGITLRKNPAAHRRMMILATIALADPGFSRITGWVWPAEPPSPILWHFYIFYGNIVLIALMTAWDWWRGRLVRSFMIGAAALLTAECVSTFLYFWGPWKKATMDFVVGWAKHFA